MATERDEVIPDPSIVEHVVSQAILPTIAEIEQTLGVHLRTLIVVCCRDERTSLREVGPPDGPAGEFRLRFRKTFKPERLRFYAESRYEQAKRGSKLRGIDVTGDVVKEGDEVIVTTKNSTVRYGTVPWRGWV